MEPGPEKHAICGLWALLPYWHPDRTPWVCGCQRYCILIGDCTSCGKDADMGVVEEQRLLGARHERADILIV